MYPKQNKLNTNNYIVGMIRKSDNRFFIAGNTNNPFFYGSYDEALKEAKRKAVNCSDNYMYVVVNLELIATVEKQEPPLKVTIL